MCGIVGVVGKLNTKEILINGLQKLEYRGYDSAGIYVNDGQNGSLVKETGKIKDLEKIITDNISGEIGIGHTRWATHGKPTVENAHPQFSEDERFYLVHNGVITNYDELKSTYLSDVKFVSQTDTEVAVQLVSYFSKQGMNTTDAFKKMVSLVEGSFAFGLIDSQDADRIFVAKNKSPLLVGIGDGFNVICSDAMAMIDQTNQFLELMDGEIVVLEKNVYHIFDKDNKEISRNSYTVDLDPNDISKGTYPHYMLKEVDEQPAVMRKISEHYLSDGINVDADLVKTVSESDRIYIVAAGTSYHAGLVGKEILENLTDIPVDVEVASEFGYHIPKLSKKPFFIFLTQSGETADSRQVLVQVNELELPSLTITNVKDSTLWRESTYQMELLAGPEIAVASTKAYTAQIAIQAVLAKVVGTLLNNEQALNLDLKEELSLAANGMQTIIDEKDMLKSLTHDFFENQDHAFYIGRGVDYAVSIESALKLKEISYIHTEGFAAGELKHGTISLIEEQTPVVAFINDPNTAEHTRGNIKEVQARGANVLVIANEKFAYSDDQIILSSINELLEPLISVVPAQLLAYYASLERGNDVDQPRNLAKSVTVE
ncbi:glutamine--fructose-6-phosphate aminotransferase [isomerizing] [Companilactobacillus sp. RD055328]|uniref:glutamine--fructose-6-phosphate transaminase (isomerizing) n=1 Tax=Companilactobacillus sp. RD055328 TaxID=2916634 RepID=UPI001FC83A0B|nr:glutamine--fructose-6-phosphate transaminase (isomerizing) [Companilactobacillus sp. RD055328]GKQ42997.1 glutamine--fructose-6-phosphate aminotransferase [isomerizing] [Companilactobacillus sp. RD055328]